jgi:uncharacterized protein YndB with AHSA1/START domain
MKTVLLVLVVAILGFAGFVATRPESYHVERSIDLKSPPEAVFATVSDFKAFPQWSPWQKRDPAMKTTLSSPSSGVGASFAWEGNKEVGKGKMTMVESTAPNRIKIRLEFQEPWTSIADTGFDIKSNPASAGGSSVTWWMDGKNNFVGKAFAVFMDMDKMIGKDYEEGLASLKMVVEAQPPAAPATPPTAAAPAAPAAPVKN